MNPVELAKVLEREAKKPKSLRKIKIYLIYMKVETLVWRDFSIDWETTTIDDTVSKIEPGKKTVYFQVLRRIALIPTKERLFKFQKYIRKF